MNSASLAAKRITESTAEIIISYPDIWDEDAEERRTRVYGDSKFAEFIKNRKLDFYEVCDLFVYKDSHLYCSAKRLAEGYERLMEEAEKLNPKKKKAVYGVVGKKKSEIYKDMTWDLDGFCYRNDRFLKYLNAMAELITRRPQRNDMSCSGNIIIPLTEEQQNKLDSIEKDFSLIDSRVDAFGNIKHVPKGYSFDENVATWFYKEEPANYLSKNDFFRILCFYKVYNYFILNK